MSDQKVQDQTEPEVKSESPKMDPIKIFDGSPIPFSPDKQRAFIGHLLDDSTGLWRHYGQMMTKDWFSDEGCAQTFQLVQRWWQDYGSVPNQVELQDCSWILAKDTPTQGKIRGAIQQGIVQRGLYSMKALEQELGEWKDAKIIERTLIEGAKAFNSGDFKAVKAKFDEAVKLHRETSFAGNVVSKFSDVQALLDDLSGSHAVRFGLKPLDEHMWPEKDGGLKCGDQTLLIGGSNSGKTFTMITCSVINVLAGKRVGLVSLEGSPLDLKQKVIRSSVRLVEPATIQEAFQLDEAKALKVKEIFEEACKNPNELLRVLADPKKGKILKKWMEWLDERLVYMPYNRAGMEVESLVPAMEMQQSLMKDRTGKGFDMVTIDYPAKLTTVRASKGRLDYRHIIDMVYDVFVQMALQHQWHSLVAIQANRQGAKINNRTADDERLLEMTDAAEAWGPVTTASSVITINRPPEAQRRNMTVYKLVKSRQSSVGLVVTATSDYARGLAYGNTKDFGCLTHFNDRMSTRILEDKLMPGVFRHVTPEEELGFLGQADNED